MMGESARGMSLRSRFDRQHSSKESMKKTGGIVQTHRDMSSRVPVDTAFCVGGEGTGEGNTRTRLPLLQCGVVGANGLITPFLPEVTRRRRAYRVVVFLRLTRGFVPVDAFCVFDCGFARAVAAGRDF
jgi:hypothetical protein